MVLSGLPPRRLGERGAAWQEVTSWLARRVAPVLTAGGPHKLVTMARALNQAVAGMRDALVEVRDISNGLAVAAQQLNATSEEVASGTQEQASSVEETAANLEEITQRNADNAQHVRQFAQSSRTVAEKGGNIVAGAVQAMPETNRSSKKIADIINVIDEIAFQTNLLALKHMHPGGDLSEEHFEEQLGHGAGEWRGWRRMSRRRPGVMLDLQIKRDAAMTLSFDFYFSFRSPYSYLATPAIAALLERHDAAVRMRIVRPIAVRIPGFFQQVNPLWPPYLARDTKRVAEMNGIPYRWPRPDPIVQNRETWEVATEQPFIMRVSRLGVAAEEQGNGFAFVRAASHMMWSGETDDWHEGGRLARAADAAGLDGAALEEAAAADAARLDAVIEGNEAAQNAAGHWGVPLFVFEGEPFFGQDRIDHLLWRMKQRDLRER